MEKSKSIIQMFTGLALSTTLFLGCQDFMGQKSDGNLVTKDNEAPQEVALQLSIKDSGACLELKNHIQAAHEAQTAHEAGSALLASDSAFLTNCVHEVRHEDASKPKPIIPPVLTPDDRTRCHWIVAQIDRGREEMVIKYRYYCPDDCNNMARGDSVVHEKYCRDPKPDCMELKAKLAHMDPASEEFARLHHLIGDICMEHPPIDSLPPMPHGDSLPPMPHGDSLPPKPHCDSLPPIPHGDSLPPLPHGDSLPPKPHGDSLPPIMPPAKISCDSLRILIAHSDVNSEAYAKYKRIYGETCVDLKPPVILPPVPPTCDELRKKLALLDPASADYAHLKGSIAEHCVEKPIIK
jgi:hypothetical protein